jgi:succinate dehydrogenase/fumarate reductase flavoprotein subunit
MIINVNNNNQSLFKGLVKRGFNQDPKELREKLQRQMVNPIKKEIKDENPNYTVNPSSMQQSLNNIQRLNK